jgi:hypothetical protein
VKHLSGIALTPYPQILDYAVKACTWRNTLAYYENLYISGLNTLNIEAPGFNVIKTFYVRDL